ncbi:MAG: hypothetical protein IIU04_04720, partial [Bacteroidales bacterium]|nr:hypothetical protein [Bacteroidales bacterium]
MQPEENKKEEQQEIPVETVPEVQEEEQAEEKWIKGYGGATVRDRRAERGANRPKTYAEWQAVYAAKRKKGKRHLVICAIPVIALVVVGLLGYRGNRIVDNDSLESMISDEVLQNAQVVDLDDGQPFDGMDEETSEYVREMVRL